MDTFVQTYILCQHVMHNNAFNKLTSPVATEKEIGINFLKSNRLARKSEI